MHAREELVKRRRENALLELGGGVVCEEVDVDVLESQRRAGEAADAREVTVVARLESLGEPDEYRVDERAARVRVDIGVETEKGSGCAASAALRTGSERTEEGGRGRGALVRILLTAGVRGEVATGK